MKKALFVILALVLAVSGIVVAQETLTTATVKKTANARTQSAPLGFSLNQLGDYLTTVVIKQTTAATADTSSIYKMYSHVNSFLVGTRVASGTVTVVVQGALAFHSVTDSMKFTTIDTTIALITTSGFKAFTTTYPFLRFVRLNRTGNAMSGEVYVYPRK